MRADLLPIVLSAFCALIKESDSLSFRQEPTGTGYYKRRDVVRLFCQTDSSNPEITWYLNGIPLQHHSSGGSSKTARSGSSHFRSFIRRDTFSNSNRTVHSDYIIERISNGSSLVFAPFRPQANAGEYHCAASDAQSGVTILSRSVLLKKPVAPKPVYEEYMRSVEALAGNNVVLNCTQPVHAEPAVYKWRYRKSLILAEFKDIDSEESELPFGKAVTTPNGNLFLYNVSTHFEGDYRCVTVNELLEKAEATSYYYRLFVRSPKSLRNPVISHFPWFSSTQIEAGQPFTLECNADGAPRPTVAWRFSSYSNSVNRFGRNSQYKHKLQTQYEGILTINNASLDDSGIYACELEPAGSEFIKTVNVTVVPPMNVQIFTHGDDEDGNLTSSLDLTVGATASLRCSANRPIANTQFRVLWLRNGVLLGEEAMGVHQEVYASGANLVISNAQLGDSGVYQCFLAEEQANKNANNAAALRSPFGALVASNNVDYYNNVPQQQSASTSGPASDVAAPLLIYNVHSDAFISVTWPLTTVERKAEESGATTPSAQLLTSEALLTTTMSDESLFEAPIITRVERQTSSIDLHWEFKPPQLLREALLGFIVEYCKIKCDKWLVGANVNASHRSASISDILTPEQKLTAALPDASSFLFRVIAKFRAPYFTATSGLMAGNATTQPLVVEPITPPAELKAMAIGSDRIAAVWRDSAQLDALSSAIRDKLWYEIQWRPLGSSNGDSSNVYEVQHFSVRKPISSVKNAAMKVVPFVVLVDLSSSTFYEIRVRYIRLHDSVGQVDAISSWSTIVHAETAILDTPPLLDTYNMKAEALGVAVSALFFPRIYDLSSTPISSKSNEGLFGSSSELLYTVLGIVMGCLVITLVVFVVLCALRQKRQRKYIQNMRRQLNRLPSKENLNRLLTPGQLAQPSSGQKMFPQFAAASPQGTSLSHQNHSMDENGVLGNGSFMNASARFQQHMGLFTGSALSSPTAVSAALAADISDNILVSENRGYLNSDRPKLTMINKGNAYGTMSRIPSGGPKQLNGSINPLQSPHVAHNPYYRTLDSHRMMSNGGGVSQPKYNFMNGNGSSKNGTPVHLMDQQQPLLSTAESAFVEPPYELPSSVVAAQQQRLILANQHALAGLGGPPISAAAASSPANTVAQHYSTYSTFGRKNPLSTTISNKFAGSIANNSNMFFNDGGCPDGVALTEMGITANGIFISNAGAVDSSGRSGVGLPASLQSSSTSPSATVAMQLGSITYNANGHANGSINGGGGPQSTISGSDQNVEDGNANFTVEVAPMGNGQRYGINNRGNSANMSSALGVTYRPPPQLSFLT